jgi:hypothetical protein
MPFAKGYAEFVSVFCYAYVLGCSTGGILFNERFPSFGNWQWGIMFIRLSFLGPNFLKIE